MSSGKSAGQARSDIETIGSGNAAASSSRAADVGPDHRRPHLRHQRREGVVVERLCRPVEEVGAALVVDRRRRQTGLDQLDPPTVHDLVVRRGRDGHGPAEVMGDAEAHATDSAQRAPPTARRGPTASGLVGLVSQHASGNFVTPPCQSAISLPNGRRNEPAEGAVHQPKEPRVNAPAPTVHIFVLLDRSGSMSTMAEQVVAGFNRLLREQQADGPDARMTLVQFDDVDPQDIVVDAVPIAELLPLRTPISSPGG